jgi:kynurenine formamidase
MSPSTKRFIDLSHPLTSGIQIYPSDPTFNCKTHATHAKDGYCVHHLSLGTHTGTHIDAPYHFFPNGRKIGELELEELVGDVAVVNLSGLEERQRISWEILQPYAQLMHDRRILLINTGWSRAHYQTPVYFSHPYLAPNVATEILAQGIRVVGVDTLNPDETPSAFDTVSEGLDGFGFHEAFLGAGGIIAENLTNLEELLEAQSNSPEDEKWIVNLVPLNLAGADGSPVRAFAQRVKK